MPTDPLHARHRAVLSCARCHRQKKKCDRTAPCSNCSHHGQECVYRQPSQNLLPAFTQSQLPVDQVQTLHRGSASGDEIRALHSRRRFSAVLIPESQPNSNPAMLLPCPASNVNYLLESFLSLLDLRSRYCLSRPRTIDGNLHLELFKSETVKHAAVYLGARMYAAQLGSVLGKLPPEPCLHYKVSAIQTIKCAVEDSDLVSDEDILAVIFMTMSYNKHLDHQSEREAHLNGIEKMICARGGWHVVGYNGLLQDLYTWCLEYGETSALCASFAPDI